MPPPISKSQLQARIVSALKGQKFVIKTPDGIVTVDADVDNSALAGIAEAIAIAVHDHLKEDVIVDCNVGGVNGIGVIR